MPVRRNMTNPEEPRRICNPSGWPQTLLHLGRTELSGFFFFQKTKSDWCICAHESCFYGPHFGSPVFLGCSACVKHPDSIPSHLSDGTRLSKGCFIKSRWHLSLYLLFAYHTLTKHNLEQVRHCMWWLFLKRRQRTFHIRAYAFKQ